MIYHLAEPADWSARTDIYAAPSLESERFIHCATSDQVDQVAAEIFPGREDLVLLIIDESRLPYPVVYEDSHGSGQDFPHVYGPVPLEAILDAKLYEGNLNR